jgi:hypothetical protein
MNSTLTVYHRYPEDCPAITQEERRAFFWSMAKQIGKRANADNISLVIAQGTMTDVARIEEQAGVQGIPVVFAFSESFVRGDLARFSWVRLAIDGDYVDLVGEGGAFNSYPNHLCGDCRMPDEAILPSPFIVMSRQLRRRSQDGIPGHSLAYNREVLQACMGVLILSDRVKLLFETLVPDQMIFSPVRLDPDQERCRAFWAARPKETWGTCEGSLAKSLCPSCGAAIEQREAPSQSDRILWDSRIILSPEEDPTQEVVSSRTWYGNRASDPYGYIRMTFVPGWMAEVLLRCDIRGIVVPDAFVSFGSEVPSIDQESAQALVNQSMGRAENAGLTQP